METSICFEAFETGCVTDFSVGLVELVEELLLAMST
jgi:hypothetical protein